MSQQIVDINKVAPYEGERYTVKITVVEWRTDHYLESRAKSTFEIDIINAYSEQVRLVSLLLFETEKEAREHIDGFMMCLRLSPIMKYVRAEIFMERLQLGVWRGPILILEDVRYVKDDGEIYRNNSVTKKIEEPLKFINKGEK